MCRFAVEGAHHGARRIQSLESAAGLHRHSPLHRFRLRLECLQHAVDRVLGVVAPAADDWSSAERHRGSSTVAIVFLGLVGRVRRQVARKSRPAHGRHRGRALLGRRLPDRRPRHLSLHQLWLVYLGYGVIGGCGLGLGYVSPVSTLIRWFPDRRGMAAGMAIMGFGGGAIDRRAAEALLHSARFTRSRNISAPSTRCRS